jgi:hypothetical protein
MLHIKTEIGIQNLLRNSLFFLNRNLFHDNSILNAILSEKAGVTEKGRLLGHTFLAVSL